MCCASSAARGSLAFCFVSLSFRVELGLRTMRDAHMQPKLCAISFSHVLMTTYCKRQEAAAQEDQETQNEKFTKV
jgi:hypothetical protein